MPVRGKSLLLPMDTAVADKVALRCRIALEAIRQGHADPATAQCLLEPTLMTGFINDAGHGQIPPSLVDDAEIGLYQYLGAGPSTKASAIQPWLIDVLTMVVNEHDRQLH